MVYYTTDIALRIPNEMIACMIQIFDKELTLYDDTYGLFYKRDNKYVMRGKDLYTVSHLYIKLNNIVENTLNVHIDTCYRNIGKWSDVEDELIN